MWKSILVPHDFSVCSAEALRLALALAKVHGSKITILHVSSLSPNIAPEALITPPGEKVPVRVDDYAMRGACRELEEIALPLRDSGVEISTLAVAARDVSEEITAVAARLSTDVIVVGTHGRVGLAHLMLGSVAEKVIRRAVVPVVAVRSTVADPPHLTSEERTVQDELAG